MSLSAFRGKVVILAFTDSECTTICPLTTASMVAAKDLLGKAGDQVQLLGIDANPEATSRSNVMAYSQSHGMVNQWDFLTGSLAQLKATWKDYHVYVQIEQGQIDHTPALYVIDTHGRERKLYLTTMAYTTIGQAGELLAQEASSLLPGHPKLASQESLGQIANISPATAATVPAVSGPGTTSAGTTGGTIALGPGQARMVVFFASWLSETSDLAAQLDGLNAYAQAAAGGKLPALVGVDEAVTEPSPGTIGAALAHLPAPLQLSRRAGQDRPDRRRLRRPGPAVVRAGLGDREGRCGVTTAGSRCRRWKPLPVRPDGPRRAPARPAPGRRG